MWTKSGIPGNHEGCFNENQNRKKVLRGRKEKIKTRIIFSVTRK